MQITPPVAAALDQVAWRYQVDPQALRQAIENESAAALAELLQLSPAAAAERMARIQRTVTIESDWGAGCKLLTDDVQAELLDAIAAL
jgi:hypothetical protein